MGVGEVRYGVTPSSKEVSRSQKRCRIAEEENVGEGARAGATRAVACASTYLDLGRLEGGDRAGEGGGNAGHGSSW